MQKQYTGFEWICVDIGNQAGLDKELFETRIAWVKDNINRLTVIATPQKERPLYVKAVLALFDAMRGNSTGHLVGLDATCSGMSIMSVLTKCYKGCLATNLIDPNVRNDAYTMVTDAAKSHLPSTSKLTVSRADAKAAVMTGLYGSLAEPENIFGEDTPELAAFYDGLYEVAPGAVELLGDLRSAWQPFALEHRWALPDNFNAIIPVMQKVENARVEVDELDHATFTYEYYVNQGTKKDLKLIANVVHSFDAYLLRSLERRCNYNRDTVLNALSDIQYELASRVNRTRKEQDFDEVTGIGEALVVRWFSSNVPDARILDFIDADLCSIMSTEHLNQVNKIGQEMLAYESFEIMTVHDEFKCHPNNCNQMRKHYVSILADLARGHGLEDVFEQITGHVPHYKGAMNGQHLATLIENSCYAIS